MGNREKEHFLKIIHCVILRERRYGAEMLPIRDAMEPAPMAVFLRTVG